MKFDDDLADNSSGALETLVSTCVSHPYLVVEKTNRRRVQIRAGMSIGRSPGEPQWAPDMRKDAGDVTDYDKREAKRRIRGSASAEDSPEDSGGDEQLSLPPPIAS